MKSNLPPTPVPVKDEMVIIFLDEKELPRMYCPYANDGDGAYASLAEHKERFDFCPHTWMVARVQQDDEGIKIDQVSVTHWDGELAWQLVDGCVKHGRTGVEAIANFIEREVEIAGFKR